MGDLAVACLLPHVRMGGETVTLNRTLDKVSFLVVLSLPAHLTRVSNYKTPYCPKPLLFPLVSFKWSCVA